MSIIERLNHFKEAWSLLLSECPTPEDRQIGRWLSQFDDEEIDYALRRTSQKFRQGSTAEQETVCRYVTGVIINERKQGTCSVQ